MIPSDEILARDPPNDRKIVHLRPNLCPGPAQIFPPLM